MNRLPWGPLKKKKISLYYQEMLLDKLVRDIANANFDILFELQEHQKLCVDEEGRLTLDDRYLQGVRRAWSRDSREDLLPLLEMTMENCERSNDDIVGLCAKLRMVLSKTYFNFLPLQTLLRDLIHRHNCEPGRRLNKPLPEHLESKVGWTEELRRNGLISDSTWDLIGRDDNKSQAIIEEIQNTTSDGTSTNLYCFDILMYTVHYCKMAVKTLDTTTGTTQKVLKEIHYNSLPYITVLLSS